MTGSARARIVLIGKSSKKNKNTLKGSVLKDINPVEIPRKFISKIELVLEDNRSIEFNVNKILTENFTIDAVEHFLSSVKNANNITCIEITLDLDLIYSTLQEDADNIFSAVFKE